MKIGILGTRGIPNNYGGFEQFAEMFSIFAIENGHEVYVYNSHNHTWKENTYKGVHIIHKYDPEYKIGTAGQFIYDLNCIFDSRSRNFDIILQLGYSSSAIWNWLPPSYSQLVTNMDGLEWKRSKFSPMIQKFLKISEQIVAKGKGKFIADSIGIQQYIKSEYNIESNYIAYGAEMFNTPNEKVLSIYCLKPYQYDLIIARMEPENNIEMIIEGYLNSNSSRKLIIIGKINTPFASYLMTKYKETDRLEFIGGVYNQEHLNNIRFFSNLYFHGHSVGGTNPSLLEAMSTNCLIVAHDNIFNKSILEEDAYYFSEKEDITEILSLQLKKIESNFLENNSWKVKSKYSWEIISKQYLDYFARLRI